MLSEVRGGVMSKMVLVVGVVDRGGSRRLLPHERMEYWCQGDQSLNLSRRVLGVVLLV